MDSITIEQLQGMIEFEQWAMNHTAQQFFKDDSIQKIRVLTWLIKQMLEADGEYVSDYPGEIENEQGEVVTKVVML